MASRKGRFKQLLTETTGFGSLPGSASLFSVRLVLFSVILQRRVSLVLMHGSFYCCHRLFFHPGILCFQKEMLDIKF